MSQQTMDTGHTDVIDMLDRVPHHFCRDDRFFGDGNVARPRRNYGNDAFAVALAIALENDGSCQRTVLHFRHLAGDCLKLFFGRPRGENIPAMICQSLKNTCDLPWSLSLAEYDFRYSLAKCPVMIDLGKSEVFEREVAQPFDGLIGAQYPCPNLFKQLS